MSVGTLLTKTDLDDAISGYATRLHGINTTLAYMVAKVAAMTDTQIEALGYTPTERQEIRDYYNAMGNFLLNATGGGVIADGTNVKIMAIENAKYVRFGA